MLKERLTSSTAITATVRSTCTGAAAATAGAISGVAGTITAEAILYSVIRTKFTPAESDSLTGVALSVLSPDFISSRRGVFPEEAAVTTVNCKENSKAATGRKRSNMTLDCRE